jgi:hypothetical protein
MLEGVLKLPLVIPNEEIVLDCVRSGSEFHCCTNGSGRRGRRSEIFGENAVQVLWKTERCQD